MVEHGNHPDLHRLEPEGPGGQIRIGDRQHPEPGTVRGLAVELALLPVEGGERVAIVRDAQRMNDDAQSALLKTLEEPPAGTTRIQSADDEERLLPTVRSRCARVRLGPASTREIERLLAERGLADAPTAARLARLAAGRSGIAVAYASAPEAETIRGELARTLLDLVGEGRAARVRAARDLLGRASALAALAMPPAPATERPVARRGRGRAATGGTGAGPMTARSTARTRPPGPPEPAACPTTRPRPPRRRASSPQRSAAAPWACCSTPGGRSHATSHSPSWAPCRRSGTWRCWRSSARSPAASRTGRSPPPSRGSSGPASCSRPM
jgi:hypothetical protein